MVSRAPVPLFYLFLACVGIRPGSAEVRISPRHRFIRYSGRVDTSDLDTVRFDWPGISIETRFEGTSCALGLDCGTDSYNLFVDGEFVRSFTTDSSKKRYELVSGLSDGVHHLLVTKRFETLGKATACTGLFLDEGRTVQQPPPPPRYRIEFIGASTLLGYGIESPTYHCDTVRTKSNCYLSFGPLTGRLVGAECSILAITRKGLVRNYRSPFLSSPNSFPGYYRRSLFTDSLRAWNWNRWIPHVVVVTLGINDFSSYPHPTRELFSNRYFAFVQEISARCPGAHIICLTPPKEPFRSYTRDFVARERARGNSAIHFLSYDKIPDWHRGCNWHPNAKAHRRIAEQLVKVIRPILQSADH